MGLPWNFLSTNGKLTRAYVGEDAGRGAVSLYGLRSDSFKDLSVSHWRRTGVHNEPGVDSPYSKHGRTRVLDTNHQELPVNWVDGEPVYEVRKGQKVRAEFTVENNGKFLNYTRLHYYLSNDAWISPTDRYLTKTKHQRIRPNKPWLSWKEVNIPQNLISGRTYYLGVIVDSEDKISEVAEFNNRTYVAIKVK
jgi:hypothetical protein